MKKIELIIKEEIQNVTSGSGQVIKDDRLKFAEPINATFKNYEAISSDYDVEVDPTKVIVYWSVYFWVNPYGIHSFNIEVDKVEGQYNVRFRDLHSDEMVQQGVKNLNEIDWHFVIDKEAGIFLGGGLYVTELNFDFKDNVCYVMF